MQNILPQSGLVRTDEFIVVGEGELAEVCSMRETLSLEQLGC